MRPDQHQRSVRQVTHLQQLPDHHRLEHRPDAARRDDEGVRRDDELMEPREERLVRERFRDERVRLLLERQVHEDPVRTAAARRLRALVGRLHQAGAASGDDVAAHRRKRFSHAPGLGVRLRAWPNPRRSEDRDAIGLPARRPQARERVDRLPEAQNRRPDGVAHGVFVGQADQVRGRRRPSRHPCVSRWTTAKGRGPREEDRDPRPDDRPVRPAGQPAERRYFAAAYGLPPSAFEMSAIAFCARTLLPASSSGGETTAMPNLPGETAIRPPPTPLLPGSPVR